MEKEKEDRLEILEKFYREIGRLTLEHDIINDRAIVPAYKLSNELYRVDSEWYKDVKIR